MKYLILILTSFLALQFCNTPKAGVYGEKIRLDILLQDSRGWPQYIFLKKDTAFYQRRQFDKPSYFTDLDTLLLTSNSNYQSKKSFFFIDSNRIRATFFTKKDTSQKKYFIAATMNQKKEWESFNNIDKYRKIVSDLKLNDNAQYPQGKFNDLNSDRNRLIKLASILPQKDFDSVAQVFINKYSVKNN